MLNDTHGMNGSILTAAGQVHGRPHDELELTGAGLVVTITALCISSVMGVFGNIMVLGAVWVSRELRNTRNAFIVNMALADLCVAAIADPFAIIAKMKGSIWFHDYPGLCDFIAVFCVMLCVASLLSLTGVSINRYVHICHNEYYEKIFTKPNTVAMCLSFWFIGGVVCAPAFHGWGGMTFDKKSLECIWDRTADFGYSVFILIFLVGSPLALIAYSFARIYIKLQQIKKQMAQHNEAKGKSNKDSVRLAKTLFTVFLAFTFCWTPYGLVSLLDRQDSFPAGIHVWVIIQAHFHSSVNSYMYCITHSHFRRGYMKFLHLRKCFKSRVQATSMVGPTSITKVERGNSQV